MPDPLNFSEDEADLLAIAQPTEEDIKAEEDKKQRLELRNDLLRDLMRNDIFREWLMEVLIGFDTFGNPFGHGPTGFPDHMATEFKLGMKTAGWFLWETMDDLAPDLASLMRREATKRA